MKYKFFFFLLLGLSTSISTKAQKVSSADSIWCDNLNNIIRCVSMKQIFEPVGKVKDSAYILPMIPNVKLLKSEPEMIGKRNGKVEYIAHIQSEIKNKSDAEASMNKWYKKFKSCLNLWEEVRLDNYDKSIGYKDYFFTNSEDESSVRISIVHDHSYHVRITIY